MPPLSVSLAVSGSLLSAKQFFAPRSSEEIGEPYTWPQYNLIRHDLCGREHRFRY